jgi:hypothetical protein
MGDKSPKNKEKKKKKQNKNKVVTPATQVTSIEPKK